MSELANVIATYDGGSVATHSFIDACRADPNPFIEYVLDVKQAPVHEDLQDFYTEHNDCGAGLSRGHGKTVQTITRTAWDIGKDPSERIKYIQQNKDEAAKSVGMCKTIIESDRFRDVFPDIKPDATKWGTMAFRVVNDGLHRDSTLEGAGIFGHAGGRASMIVYDDICDLENAIRQPSMRSQVKEAVANTWSKMLVGKRKVRRVFTPWHVADIGAEWRKQLGADGRLFWRPCIGFESPWPEFWTEERLRFENSEHGPVSYARAYLLEPVSAELLIWPHEWLDDALFDQMPREAEKSGSFAMTIDWAFTEKRTIKTGKSSDPDWSVALIAKITPKGHVWVHDMIRVRKPYPEFCKLAIQAGEDWNVTRGRAEGGGPQDGLVQQFREDASFPMSRVTRNKDKVTRASETQPFVMDGRFHILAKPDRLGVLRPIERLAALYDEMVTFPAGEHDDCADTAMDMIEEASMRKINLGKSNRIQNFETGGRSLFGM